jgi:hypothetical protein
MPEHRCSHCGALLKHCPRCDRVLSSDRFTRSSKSAAGLSCWCRECQKDHRSDPARKARQREVNRAKTAARTAARRAQGRDAPSDAPSLEERLVALEAMVRKQASSDG